MQHDSYRRNSDRCCSTLGPPSPARNTSGQNRPPPLPTGGQHITAIPRAAILTSRRVPGPRSYSVAPSILTGATAPKNRRTDLAQSAMSGLRHGHERRIDPSPIQSMNTDPSLSRRAFLRAASLVACSTGLTTNRLAAQQTPASPLWTVACRDIHLKVTGQPDCWSALKALDAKGAEVRVNEDLSCASLYHPNRQVQPRHSRPDQATPR